MNNARKPTFSAFLYHGKGMIADIASKRGESCICANRMHSASATRHLQARMRANKLETAR